MAMGYTRLLSLAVSVLCVGLFSGCATTNLMERSEDISSGGVAWESYADAKVFFDKIENGKTDYGDLVALGLDLDVAKNVRTLATPALIAHFSDSSFANYDRLPLGVQKCLKFEEQCIGYLIRKDVVNRSGMGSLALRILRFREEYIIRGFEVEILLLVRGDGVVVYKDIEGTPNGTEHRKKIVRPLGPLDGYRMNK